MSDTSAHTRSIGAATRTSASTVGPSAYFTRRSRVGGDAFGAAHDLQHDDDDREPDGGGDEEPDHGLGDVGTPAGAGQVGTVEVVDARRAGEVGVAHDGALRAA